MTGSDAPVQHGIAGAPGLAPVLTIDGPSGSGKGTLAGRLARQLGWHLLDSGALYRITALQAEQRGVGLSDESALADLAASLVIDFPLTTNSTGQWQATLIMVDGHDVGAAIRAESVSQAASVVAQLPLVRAALLDLQRRQRRAPGLVADGRDMGTVVFPDAPAKVFLTASAEQRAARRFVQLKEKGFSANLPTLIESIRERDARDRDRAASPLVPANDAVVIDSSSMSPQEVEQRTLKLLKDRGLADFQ